ncbi:hypothetical protein ABWL39_02680 [Chitinivorax sp. PXF-14]|uniref:hypothetical protein n=1 Tax=Chitinivorax sp. PXF-14 TaxID=3230488 RepID=UPI0034670CDE
MNRTSRLLLSSALLAALALPAMPVLAHDCPHDTATTAAPKLEQTRAVLRDLWVGHAFWVRDVVEQTLAGNTAAAAEAEKQVVANARQIAGAIEPFYGKPASDRLFGLLTGHYGAVKQYLEAAKARSTAKQDAATKALTDNAGEIAVFLSGANPNLPLDTLRGLLLAHGGHHIQQITQLRDKQYAQEAETWAAMKDHMYVIADALAGALAKQFPAKFA